MFDGNQIVQAKWTTRNMEWYLQKGYEYKGMSTVFDIKAKDLTHGSKIKVKVTCDCCGEQYSLGYGTYLKAVNKDLCGLCAHRKTAQEKMKAHAKLLIQKAKQFCKEKEYILLTTEKEYNGVKGNVRFVCPIHGEQIMSMDNLIQGHGCKECARELVGHKVKLSKEEIIKRVESINGNKLLNPDDYIDIFKNNMLIRCSCGNTFITSIQNYKVINRCQQCSNSESKGEVTIRKFLEDNEIAFEQEKRFDDCRDKVTLPFDFYLPDYNLCIEYDGEQHYWPVFSEESTKLTQLHDVMKNKYCEENNIGLIRIPYYEFKNINKLLSIVLQVKDIV